MMRKIVFLLLSLAGFSKTQAQQPFAIIPKARVNTIAGCSKWLSAALVMNFVDEPAAWHTVNGSWTTAQ